MQQDISDEPFDPTYWGVPDWRVGGPSVVSWAWEFLRRNWDYRKFWQKEVLPFIDPATGRLRDDSNEVAKNKRAVENWIEGYPELQDIFLGLKLVPLPGVVERFGILSIADPRQSSSVVDFKLSGAHFYGGPVPPAVKKVFGDSLGSRMDLAKDEVAVVFDLRWPIDGQLEVAGLTLRMCQQEWGYDPPNRRGRPDKYEQYVRILDADDCGVDDDEIAGALFPRFDDGPQSVRNARRGAHKLRDGGYRSIAAQEFAARHLHPSC